MYVFSERTFDVSNYSSAISSIAFSKCTKFFNNCLIEPPLIITKSRAKLKVILSENYCILLAYWATNVTIAPIIKTYSVRLLWQKNQKE